MLYVYKNAVPLCMTGQAQLIDLLVRKGAPVNATDYHVLTPLHLACQRGYQGVTVSIYSLFDSLMHHDSAVDNSESIIKC